MSSKVLQNAEEEPSPLHIKRVQLRDKGAILSKAWADLFCFLTEYQAELSVKENHMMIEEKEIQVQRKQLEEIKSKAGASTDKDGPSLLVMKLQEECFSKDCQLRKVKTRLNEKENELKCLQIEFDTMKELCDKSQKDLELKNTQLMVSKKNADHHKSQANMYQIELGVNNDLVNKVQQQLMKEGTENTQLRQLLQKERREHAATKGTEGGNSYSTDSQEEQIDLLTASEQANSVFNEPFPKCEITLQDVADTSSDALMLPPETNTSEGDATNFSIISPSVSSESIVTQAWASAATTTGQGMYRSLINPDSMQYYPLDAGQDTKNIVILTVKSVAGEDQGAQASTSSGSVGNRPSDHSSVVPVSQPIPSAELGQHMEYEGEEEMAGAEDSSVDRAPIDGADDTTEHRVIRWPSAGWKKKSQRKLCETCGKSFASPFALKAHTTSFHGAEVGFKCPVCGKWFLVKNRYQSHLDSHNGVKKFHCTICDRYFSTQGSLKQHKVSAHEKNGSKQKEKKPFGCQACTSSFDNPSYLKEHEAACLGKRQYTCKKCGKIFKWRSSFAKHKKGCKASAS